MVPSLLTPSQPDIRIATVTAADRQAIRYTAIQPERTVPDYPTNYPTTLGIEQVGLIAGALLILFLLICLEVWIVSDLLEGFHLSKSP